MKKINLSKEMLDAEEQPNKDRKSCGFFLAKYLMDISTTNPLVAFKIAMALLDDKEIEVDEDEYKFLQSVLNEGNMSNIMSARILMELNNAK